MHLFHRWKTVAKGDTDNELDGQVRECLSCGKRQRLSVHVLGYHPYDYVKTWYSTSDSAADKNKVK